MNRVIGKKIEKILALPQTHVNLISFWGEQKPVATLVATGFNFFMGDFQIARGLHTFPP
jgi:hypothetical protein